MVAQKQQVADVPTILHDCLHLKDGHLAHLAQGPHREIVTEIKDEEVVLNMFTTSDSKLVQLGG
jgi:hypothetical protein